MARHEFDPDWLVQYPSDESLFFENEILTVRDTAKLLKMSTKRVYQLVAEKEIPHRRIGSEIRILRSELIGWMKGA